MKSLRVPKVDPGLVLHFHIGVQVMSRTLDQPDDSILGLLRQIGVIEIEHVVVVDAPVHGQACVAIPDGLEQAARRQVALIQAQRRQAPEQFGIDGVLAGDRQEFCVCQRWLHGRKYGRGIVAQGRAMGRLPVRSGDSATPCQWGAALERERHRQPRTQHDKQGAHAHRVP